MIKSPIQLVTDKLQYRAIGIVNGTYNPIDKDQLNRGTITDNQGQEIEAVILGKALSLTKKYINFQSSYFWIVYPKNKNTNSLHLQVAGIWDPYQFNKDNNDSSEKNLIKLLSKFNLNDNYFSIRGELVYVNTKKKEFIMRICSSNQSKKFKNNNFKLVIEGELSLDYLNNFVSLDVLRVAQTLKLVDFEVIEKTSQKNKIKM